MQILNEAKGMQVVRPQDAYTIVWSALRREDIIDRNKEHFWVLLLNARSRLQALDLVCVGGLTSAVIHPREVFVRAIKRNSASIIVAHNHPSGDATPSEEDIRLTEQLQEAGGILGIPVHDHIIVAEKGFVSLKERGLI